MAKNLVSKIDITTNGQVTVKRQKGKANAGALPKATPPSPITPKLTVLEISTQLRDIQRQRAITIKSRIMQANRLQAIVTGTLGYQSNMDEKSRLKKFKEATEVITQVAKGGGEQAPLRNIIRTTLIGINAFLQMQEQLQEEMLVLAKQLPVASWIEKPEQRGAGLLTLAIIIGETGDLTARVEPRNFPNPGKLWKRFGCAPHSFDGKMLMPSTWRYGKEGKLPALEWEKLGYSPRRRSIAYLIGEGFVKQNGAVRNGEKSDETEASVIGPYRARYDQAKLLAKDKHPEWSDLRIHRHAMLLATKLFLKNLWLVWNNRE
jgi:hypothetical protein